jgi:hypothetical protein
LFPLESYAWRFDVAFVFGIDNPRDIESHGNGQVVGAVKGSVGPIVTVSKSAA